MRVLRRFSFVCPRITPDDLDKPIFSAGLNVPGNRELGATSKLRTLRRRGTEPWKDLPEAAHGGRFVGLHVKDGEQARDLNEVVYALGQVDELQFTACAPD